MNDYTKKEITETNEDRNLEIFEKASYEDKKRMQEVKKEARSATLELAEQFEKTQGDVGINSVVKS